MAYYLYKKLRDKKRASGEQHVLNAYPSKLDRNELPVGTRPPADEIAETEHHQDERHEELHNDKATKGAMRRYRWRLIGGLFLPATVQALNTVCISITEKATRIIDRRAPFKCPSD